MELTNESASNLESYVVTDTGQIKGSKYLMTKDMVAGNDRWGWTDKEVDN